jgi:hypothetical protein
MAGRPRIIRNIKSYINNIDNHTWSGPMKMGTSPSIGVTRNYWHNYQSLCNQTDGKKKKSYDNMVFLNINPAQTPVSAGFTQSQQGLYNNYPGRAQPLTTYQGKLFAPGRMARFYNYNNQMNFENINTPSKYYSQQTVLGVTKRQY